MYKTRNVNSEALLRKKESLDSRLAANLTFSNLERYIEITLSFLI